MPTAPPPSRDPALETQVFWLKYKAEIMAVIVIALLAVAGLGGYRLYTLQRASAASALLGNAKTAQDYRDVIARYPNTPASASAYLLLAEAQRNEKKLAEANATLQDFIDKNPAHELVSTARMAMAANLQSLGKTDEALAIYQQIGAADPKDFNRPLALISEIPLLKLKNRIEEARRVCETILTEYRLPGDERGTTADNRIDSIWAGEAMRQLRLLKPSAPPTPVVTPTIPPFLAAPNPTTAAPAPSARSSKPRR